MHACAYAVRHVIVAEVQCRCLEVRLFASRHCAVGWHGKSVSNAWPLALAGGCVVRAHRAVGVRCRSERGGVAPPSVVLRVRGAAGACVAVPALRGGGMVTSWR